MRFLAISLACGLTACAPSVSGDAPAPAPTAARACAQALLLYDCQQVIQKDEPGCPCCAERKKKNPDCSCPNCGGCDGECCPKPAPKVEKKVGKNPAAALVQKCYALKVPGGWCDCQKGCVCAPCALGPLPAIQPENLAPAVFYRSTPQLYYQRWAAPVCVGNT